MEVMDYLVSWSWENESVRRNSKFVRLYVSEWITDRVFFILLIGESLLTPREYKMLPWNDSFHKVRVW